MRDHDSSVYLCKREPRLTTISRSILEVIRTELDYREEAKFTDLAKPSTTLQKRGFRDEADSRFHCGRGSRRLCVLSGTKTDKTHYNLRVKVTPKTRDESDRTRTESAFPHQCGSPHKTTEKTTLFHGDLHPGNILIDSATERMTLLDFGNVGLFPISERRNYIRLYVASLDPNP